MNRSFLAPLSVYLAAGSLASVQHILGQVRVADDASFQKTVQPFLAKNCFGCHNEKLKTANLSLEGFHDASSAERQPEVWRKVLDKLSTGKMPPPGLPLIPKAVPTGSSLRWLSPGLRCDLA